MTPQIGTTLKEIRTARKVSLRALADEAGVNHGFLSKIENNRETAGPETLERIGAALNVDVNLLLAQAGYRTMPYRVLGHIAAGAPIEATEHIETFDLTDHFAPDDHYLLRVRGDSMILEGINDGDLAIIRHAEKAKNGQIVVAVVDDGEATLKTYSKKGREVVLTPANRRLKARVYPAANVQVRGVMVGMVRTSIG